MILLKATQVTKRFGGLIAVNAVDFEIHEGEIASIIGPNGAGKTTLFNMITGIYAPDRGELVFAGTSIARRKPEQICSMGISRTFQNIRLFATMTVLENVLVGMHSRLKANFVQSVFKTRSVVHEEKAALAKAAALLDYVGLSGKENEVSVSLPYGDQRKLEIARALASDPKLLLLDEPAAGMNPRETAQIKGLIKRLAVDKHLSILLIEHDIHLVMGVSDTVTVLDYGQRIAGGTPQEVRSNPKVIEAYLGKGTAS